MTTEAVAAWVQAIGSIAAIVAAFLVSSRQFDQAIRLQQRQFRAEERRRYEALIALIEAALNEFGETLSKIGRSRTGKVVHGEQHQRNDG